MTEAGDFKETVKQHADIVRVVGEYVKLKKAGAQNFSGLCPFHSEKTPSFSVHATRQFYHCFGCGASGDVFSFVQKIENITFPEAVRSIAQKLGIPLPKMSYSSPVEAQEAKLRTVLLEVHERACDFFQECLRRPEGAHAREYLSGRGLNEEMIKAFRIGYAPDSGFLLRDRLKNEFDEETLRECGLLSWKEGSQLGNSEQQEPTTNGQRPAATMYSKFRNRVMFPIANESGRVIAFTGRTLATDEKAGPKYLNSPETAIYSKSRVLFNLDKAKEAIRKLDYAIIVEGQMDCISVYAAGFRNVIASSGTAFTELQSRLLERISKNIVVNFDPDTAGGNATERTMGVLRASMGAVTSGVGKQAVENTFGHLTQNEFNIRVAKLDPGYDPDLLIRRKGKEAYAEALRNSQPYFSYLIERARTQFPVRSAEGKVKAVNYLLPHIQRIPSRIVRDELAGEIAQKLGIDSAVLRQELRHAAANRSANPVKTPAQAQITRAEKTLVRAIACGREMQTSEDRLSTREGAEKDFDPSRQARFVLGNEHLHVGLAAESLIQCLLDTPEDADLMSLSLTDSDRSRLAAILLEEDGDITAEALEDAAEALREPHRIRRQRELRVKMEEAERRGDEQELDRLRLEKAELDRQISIVIRKSA